MEEMKKLLHTYQLSPSAPRTAPEIDAIFKLIFGMTVGLFFERLVVKRRSDVTSTVHDDEKPTLQCDHKALLQAVSMGGRFHTEISAYPYFYLFYSGLRHNYKVHIAAVIHDTQKKGPNYTADCVVVECRSQGDEEGASGEERSQGDEEGSSGEESGASNPSVWSGAEAPILYLTQDRVIKLVVEIKPVVGSLHFPACVQPHLAELFLQAWYLFYPARPDPLAVMGERGMFCLADVENFHYFRLLRKGSQLTCERYYHIRQSFPPSEEEYQTHMEFLWDNL